MIQGNLSSSDQRVYLGHVSWSTYVELSDSAESPRGRLAYDNGVLEIMSPSTLHESLKRFIGRLIEIWTMEQSIEIRSVSSTTFRRPDLFKGVEADESYYVRSVEVVRHVPEIDLRIHPPPDLVVEIDVSRSSALKMNIYAALEVAEVWRFDGTRLQIAALQEGKLDEVPESLVLPRFPLEFVARLIAERTSMGETALFRAFQQHVREMAGDDEAR